MRLYGFSVSFAFVVVLKFFALSKVAAFNLRFARPDTTVLEPYGLLEFEQNGQWHQVCDSNWGSTEAFVACGQLGYPKTVSSSLNRNIPRNNYGQTIRLQSVNCTGTESRLSECSYQLSTDSCESRRPVVLTCAETKYNGTRGIRLRGGALKGEGRVQVVKYGRWGSVCSNQWDSASANVACRQLGYGTAKTSYKSTEFGRGHGAIWYTNVTCHGNERDLEECDYESLPNTIYYSQHEGPGCSQAQLASVRCFVPDDGNQHKIQVIGGRRVGRVVVKFGQDDVWRGICSERWTLREAAVACRQLGLGYASRAYQNIGYSRRNESVGATATVTNVRCRGNETSLSECEYELADRSYFVDCGNGLRFSAFHVGIRCTSVLPDLHLDVDVLEHTIQLRSRRIKELRCAASEGCLSSSANRLLNDTMSQNTTRRFIVFTTSIWNRGIADFRPWQPSDDWEFHRCHHHYHSMQQFSHYDLLSKATNRRVAEGHKASFCLADSLCDKFASRRYYCALGPTKNEQGISIGCTDVYTRKLDCQWIDISDVSHGNYTLRVSVNPLETVAEMDFRNNDVICDLRYVQSSIKAENCRIPDDFSLF